MQFRSSLGCAMTAFASVTRLAPALQRSFVVKQYLRIAKSRNRREPMVSHWEACPADTWLAKLTGWYGYGSSLNVACARAPDQGQVRTSNRAAAAAKTVEGAGACDAFNFFINAGNSGGAVFIGAAARNAPRVIRACVGTPTASSCATARSGLPRALPPATISRSPSSRTALSSTSARFGRSCSPRGSRMRKASFPAAAPGWCRISRPVSCGRSTRVCSL